MGNKRKAAEPYDGRLSAEWCYIGRAMHAHDAQLFLSTLRMAQSIVLATLSSKVLAAGAAVGPGVGASTAKDLDKTRGQLARTQRREVTRHAAARTRR